MTPIDVTAIVFSPAWPSTDNGYGIAVGSALGQYCRIYDNVHFVGLTDSRPTRLGCPCANTQSTHVLIRRMPKVVRFFLSLASPLPASCHQFRAKKILTQVVDIIEQRTGQSERVFVIFEDLPIAISLLSTVRGKFPEIRIAIRSHNVLSKIFDPLATQGDVLSRAAWRIEISKMRQTEIRTCKNADRVWAISTHDQKEYLERLGITCSGVFGVDLDSSRFVNIPSGENQTVVFVGGVDLRKRLGLVSFIEGAWPIIRAAVPEAQLVLAGTGSERFNDPPSGIHGLGYVTDDREVWAKGSIALNPQELGSGIKLKSIIAMLSAKALVSTYTGVEGIEGENGTHFLAAPDARSLAPLVVQLMRNPTHAKQMGQAARERAQKSYSEDRLRQFALPLLEDFVGVNVYEVSGGR